MLGTFRKAIKTHPSIYMADVMEFIFNNGQLKKKRLTINQYILYV
jgi:hypothetical protein